MQTERETQPVLAKLVAALWAACAPCMCAEERVTATAAAAATTSSSRCGSIRPVESESESDMGLGSRGWPNTPFRSDGSGGRLGAGPGGGGRRLRGEPAAGHSPVSEDPEEVSRAEAAA